MSPHPEGGLPVKRSVALVIRDPSDPTRILTVQRPPDDEDLPLTWGLPAGSLRPGESWEDAVERSAREKLGLRVQAGVVLNQGTQERPGYRLEMRLYAATLLGEPIYSEEPGAGADEAMPAGAPRLDGPTNRGTRYVAWRWDRRDALLPAAARGSLCSRLLLETL